MIIGLLIMFANSKFVDAMNVNTAHVAPSFMALGDNSYQKPGLFASVSTTDDSTQTEFPFRFFRIKMKSDSVQPKATAACLLTCFKSALFQAQSLADFSLPMTEIPTSVVELATSPETTFIESVHDMGIHAFVKLLDEELCAKTEHLPPAAFLHMKFIQELICDSFKTTEEAFKFLCDEAYLMNDKLLSFAVQLIKAGQVVDVPPDGDFWTECFAMALSIFILYAGEPLKALNMALDLPLPIQEARELVISLTCDMIACNCGIFNLPLEWRNYTNFDGVSYFSKQLLKM